MAHFTTVKCDGCGMKEEGFPDAGFVPAGWTRANLIRHVAIIVSSELNPGPQVVTRTIDLCDNCGGEFARGFKVTLEAIMDNDKKAS